MNDQTAGSTADLSLPATPPRVARSTIAQSVLSRKKSIVAAPPPASPPAQQIDNATSEDAPQGIRPLVRPSLSARTLSGQAPVSRRRTPSTFVPSRFTQGATATRAQAESSHAEVFYYQKQVQAHTLMVFVLEDGEHIEGTIEWYDREAVKICRTNRQRTLIYKAGIKYIYKAGENDPFNGT